MGSVAHRIDGETLASDRQGMRIAIRGIVQGVGFRPFVYRTAHRLGVAGWVRNTSWGVEIEAQGTRDVLLAFKQALLADAPPLAQIETLDAEPLPPAPVEGFGIRNSSPQPGAFQLISPDIATCPDCLRDVLDPHDRRYRYPFTNCTNCGPRFTIIESIPYDRPRTTMRAFVMCDQCQSEYDDPLDRRFHAQPNACPVCGPHVSLIDATGKIISERDEAMQAAARLLFDGQILAIKGLGGYQLVCDARDAAAVGRLRSRKRRPHKPFAVMVSDLEHARELAQVSSPEEELLSSARAPIVLLLSGAQNGLAPNVAPGTDVVGIMLPYTPLHHILLRDVDGPLIMTSGNLSEEPIARDNDEARMRLDGIADYYLTHNRGIYSRYDDSVWFVPDGDPQPVRRARGYAPSPIRLPSVARPALACGPEMKNTFCLLRDSYAFVSQHIGDMGNADTLEHYEHTLALYKSLFSSEPQTVAVDMHPDYQATRYGQSLGVPTVRVQHHHAHMVACLTENAVHGAAIGVVLDGTGYGLDGRIWGGEFLVGDAKGFERAAHLEYLPLPGGDAAVHRPYRLAIAYFHVLLGEAATPLEWPGVGQAERSTIEAMAERGINSPPTSSMGRLFDAVSALLGICQVTSYDAQAAIELEASARTADPDGVVYGYDIEQTPDVLRWTANARTRTNQRLVQHSRQIRIRRLFADIVRDMGSGERAAIVARRFHQTTARIVVDVCRLIRSETELSQVVLTGGCFQNRILYTSARELLAEEGFQVFTHHRVPCNDGGLSLGQAVIACHATED